MSLKDEDEVLSIIHWEKASMTKVRYRLNILQMTIMWTTSSFSYYLLNFLNKYFEGSIYINYYLEGTAGIVGSVFGMLCYKYLRMQWSFIISLVIALFFAIWTMVFQEGWVSCHWVDSMMTEKSPYPPESKEDHDYHLAQLIPALVFLTKIGVNMCFQNAY